MPFDLVFSRVIITIEYYIRSSQSVAMYCICSPLPKLPKTCLAVAVAVALFQVAQ